MISYAERNPTRAEITSAQIQLIRLYLARKQLLRKSLVDGDEPAAHRNDLDFGLVDFAEQSRLDNLFRRAECSDAAILHGEDTVGKGRGHVDVVQHDDHRLAKPSSSLLNQPHDLDRMLDVQIVERLIQQHIFGILADHHGNEGALALAAGKLIQEP